MSDDAGQFDAAAEDRLVLRAKVDVEAFAVLYDRYYPRVLAYCLRRLSDRAAAEDITSEVFLNVARHLAGFCGRCGTDFRRWLFRIATNAIHAHLRQTLSRQSLLEAAVLEGRLRSEASSPNVVEEQTEWQDVLAVIGSLAEREQTIVTLRFFAGLSHDEIATVVETTPGAVRTALSRALSTVRERLRERGFLELE